MREGESEIGFSHIEGGRARIMLQALVPSEVTCS